MRQRVKVKEIAQETKETEACHHFWVIEVANGPSSRGTCKFCGEKKEFSNAFPTFNPLRKSGNPLQFPELPGVKMNKESKS
jgi:hypothetical protein